MRTRLLPVAEGIWNLSSLLSLFSVLTVELGSTKYPLIVVQPDCDQLRAGLPVYPPGVMSSRSALPVVTLVGVHTGGLAVVHWVATLLVEFVTESVLAVQVVHPAPPPSR